MKEKIIVIIGARSGSKAIKDKNIKELEGRPLLSYAISAARASSLVDRVIVSTDSERYADIAKSYGAEVPFLRDVDAALDTSNEFEYISDTLQKLSSYEGYVPDFVVRMQCTVPFQLVDDLDRSIEALLNGPELDTVMVIAEAKQHPNKALRIINDANGQKRLVDFITKDPRQAAPYNRQDAEKAYFRGNIIGCKIETITKYGSMVGNSIGYVIIPQSRAIDIDGVLDFQFAGISDEINLGICSS